MVAGFNFACSSKTEQTASKICSQARLKAVTNPVKSLQIYRNMWRNLPTAGTVTAKKCIKDVNLKIGSYRVIVRQDKNGDKNSVQACLYGISAIEIFGGTGAVTPFKMFRAIDLVKRCKKVISRAWTKYPNDPFYENLNARIDTIIDSYKR